MFGYELEADTKGNDIYSLSLISNVKLDAFFKSKD